MADDLVIVLRRACLMEDEGADAFMGGPVSLAEATAWIERQTTYFRPSDFFVLPAAGSVAQRYLRHVRGRYQELPRC